MKVSVVYHSETGNTKKVADLIVKEANKVNSIETKCMSIDNIDDTFISESTIIFFGTPTYAGTYSWQMKKWLDTYKGDLSGKIGCVFVTENYVGGGADYGEIALISELLVRGMFIHSVGAAYGKPYSHYGAVCIKDGNEEQKERVKVFTKRVIDNVNNLIK